MGIIRGLFCALFALAVQAPVAFAIPHGNTLITPDRVTRSAGKVRVDYTLPCTSNDASQVVMSNDDTGDRVVAVGVVASLEERNCHAGPGQRFTTTVDPKKFGYSISDSFSPMPSGSDDDRELARYVRSRLRGTGDRKSVEELISAEAETPMQVKDGTLRCMGYPSWEGNGKKVGSCLIEAESKESGSLRAMYIVEVGDDTEHPGEQRRFSIHQVSYRI